MDYLKLIHEADAISCVGTHDANDMDEDRILTCVLVGYYLGKINKRLNSGNAEYCDQLYAQGANAVDPTLVHLYLTNMKHNASAIVSGNQIHLAKDHAEWAPIAMKYHGGYHRMSPYVRSLFDRNAGIVSESKLCIAMPNRTKKWGGGTGHDMRIADGLGIPVINLSDELVRLELITQILSTGLVNIDGTTGATT
jgi:hypothetical protein